MEDDKKQNEPEQKQNNIIFGISIIQTLVSKVITDPTQILAGLKQILFFYRLLPAEWKRKAFWIFEKLWNKKNVVISTEVPNAAGIYNIKFENEQLKRLYDNLPQIDQAMFLQAKRMQDLIQKGFHNESDEIKLQIDQRYGQRGLNLINMITTNDINYFLDETKEPINREIESSFNSWVNNYDKISALISPKLLEKPEDVKRIIMEKAKNSDKYILINLSGKMEDCTLLINIINSMKEEKKLNFSVFSPDIQDAGFCKSLRAKINF
jgi:hypothetical protein